MSYHRRLSMAKSEVSVPARTSGTGTLKILGAAPVCVRCAARGETCCQPPEGVPLAPLTPGDVQRIGGATGLETEAFSSVRAVDPEEEAALVDQDPVLRGIVRNGKLRSLAKTPDGCVFYRHDRGCSLSYEVRPLLCRRFPLVRRGRGLSVRPGGACLAVEEAAGTPALMGSLGLTVAELARIDGQIRRDLSGKWTRAGRKTAA